MSGNVDRNGNSFGVATITLDVGSIAANTSEEETYTVEGLETGMFVSVNKPDLDAGLGIANVRVSAADTLAIQFINSTASAIDPGAGDVYTLFWWKASQIDSGSIRK
jgi:hypothetical protein